MKITKPLLSLLAVMPFGYLLAAGPGTDASALLLEAQHTANLRVPGDVNGDGTLDGLDLAAIDAAKESQTYVAAADLDLSGTVDDGDSALAILMLAGRKQVTLLVGDADFDGSVDGDDARRFLRLFAAGSQLANFSRQQSPTNQNDGVDDDDLKAWFDWFKQQHGGT